MVVRAVHLLPSSGPREGVEVAAAGWVQQAVLEVDEEGEVVVVVQGEEGARRGRARSLR